MSELAKRIAFAAVAIPIVGGVAWLGGAALAVLLAAAAGIVAWEFGHLLAHAGVQPLRGHLVALSAIIPLAAYAWFAGTWAPPISVVMLVVLELTVVALWVRGPDRRPIEAVATTLFGAVYTGGMLAFAFGIRHHRFAVDPLAGTLLVALPLLLTWGTDSAAMLVGRAWGKARLMPSISPAKTVAGAWGGALVAMVVAVVFVRLALAPYAKLTMSLGAAAAFGLLVSAAGQVGDLVESLFKRQAGVKDSSALIPGHGGALDRVDSLLFTLPFTFVLYDLLLVPAP